MIGKIKLHMKEQRLKSIHSKHRSDHLSEYEMIDRVIEGFRGEGGLKHHYQGYKLYELRNILNQCKPKSILELGTGTSSVIFAQYAEANEARLTCVDESSEWLNNTKRLIGDAGFTKGIAYLNKDRIVEKESDKVFVKYGLDCCDKEYDFVFVDGPSMRVDGVRRKDAICRDIFDVLAVCNPATVVVDIRAATVKAMASSEMCSGYVKKISDLIEGKPSENYQYFSVFTLRN